MCLLIPHCVIRLLFHPALLLSSLYAALVIPSSAAHSCLFLVITCGSNYPTVLLRLIVRTLTPGTYQRARIASDGLLFIGWVLLLIAFVVEPALQWVCRGRFKEVALMWSRVFVGGALAVMFIGVILPATPNYLAESGLETTCPLKCTPQFNVFVQSLLRNIVGLACTGLFASHLVVLLLAVPVAMVRSSLFFCKRFCDSLRTLYNTASTPCNNLYMCAWPP